MNVNATLFGQIITFALLIWFSMKFIWPPVTRAMAERQKKIADGLAAAEDGLLAREQAQQQATVTLGVAKNSAADILANAQQRASALIEAAKGEASEEGKRLLEIAQAQIEQEATRAREQLRTEVSRLVIAGAEKILAREIRAAEHQKLLDDLVAEL